MLISGLVLALAVEVHLAPDPSSPRCLTSGFITARGGDARPPVRVPMRPGERAYRLELSEESTWEITAEADGCWSETVHSASDGGALTLALHRAATVSGTFESDVRANGELRGSIFPLRKGGAGETLGVNGLATRCRLDHPRWECSVPADVPFDLRLELAGFGAVHYFGVTATEGTAKTLPPQRLLAGASLAGWIQDRARVAVPKAKVTLYPMQAHAPLAETPGLAARRHVAIGNERGFFEIAGLQPGLYRLVSEAPGFSPVNVPEVRLREGESLVWPRAIVQPPVASLEVLLSPPLDPDGNPWTVQLEEQAPLHVAPAPPLQRKASADGRWEAGSLRADLYRLRVEDRNGVPLESISVDLSDGGPRTITVDIRSIAVRGVLRIGDEPVGGHLTFTNYSGRDVEAPVSKDGRFRAIFPAGGKWVPVLGYPSKGESRIKLAPVLIDPEKAPPETLELRVPGGRVRGQVLGPQKTPERNVVVHLLRPPGGLAAHATTSDDGWFELIALAPGAYTIQASGNRIATPRPTPLALGEDETKELTLVLAPTRRLEVVVLTPYGTPASGAFVRIAPYGNDGWFTLSADAAGRFEFSIPSGVGDVPVVVATFAWPSAAVLVPAEMRGPVTIRLRPEGGLLQVRNAQSPIVRAPDVTAPLRAFQVPPPHGRGDAAAAMEPGTYVICPDRNAADDACRSVTVAPGTQQTIDFGVKKEEKEKSS